MQAKDNRMKVISEFVEGIRVVKYYVCPTTLARMIRTIIILD